MLLLGVDFRAASQLRPCRSSGRSDRLLKFFQDAGTRKAKQIQQFTPKRPALCTLIGDCGQCLPSFRDALGGGNGSLVQDSGALGCRESQGPATGGRGPIRRATF